MNSTKLYEINKVASTVENLYENETFNNSTWKYKPPFDNVGIAVHASFTIPMAVFGIFANILNIVVIKRSQKLKSVFMYYVMSLSASDLVSSCVSILMLYTHTWGFVEYHLPAIFCKISVGGDLVTSIVTSLHILVFCALRLVAVAKPHAFGRVKIVHAKISIIVIWVFASLVGIFTYGWWFTLIYIDRRNDVLRRDWTACALSYKWIPHFTRFSIYGNATLVYFPLIGIAVLSTAIGLILLQRRRQRIKADKNRPNHSNEAEMNRQKKENQALLQLVLIVFAYFFGYVPLTVTVALIPLWNKMPNWIIWWFSTSSYILLRISECLNPIFYNLGSSQLREETLIFLRQIFRSQQRQAGNQQKQAGNQQRSEMQSNRAICTRVTEK